MTLRLRGKMTVSDSQGYPWTIYLINNVEVNVVSHIFLIYFCLKHFTSLQFTTNTFFCLDIAFYDWQVSYKTSHRSAALVVVNWRYSPNYRTAKVGPALIFKCVTFCMSLIIQRYSCFQKCWTLAQTKTYRKTFWLKIQLVRTFHLLNVHFAYFLFILFCWSCIWNI